MKKLFALLVAAALVLSMMVVPSFAAVAEDSPGNYNPDTSSALQMLNVVDTLGSVISTVGDVNAVGIICPSWSNNVGNLTVTLWKWDTDYATTTASTPLKQEKFENFEDNAFLGFEFEDSDPLPKGVYYIELSEPEDDAVGAWTGQTAYPGQLTFQDGEYVPKLCLRMYVGYVTPLEEGQLPYGEMPSVEAPKKAVGGDGVEPSEYYFDMTKEDLDLFVESSTSTVEFSANEDGTLHVVVPEGANDSMASLVFANLFDYDEDVACAEYPYMAIRLRVCEGSTNEGSGEAFLYTTTIGGATAGYSSAIVYDYSTNDWQTIVIDPSANKTFLDNALEGDCWQGFRFDPINKIPASTVAFDIAWIAFFENEEAALAFDGDWAAFEERKPTPEPTPEPTATPEPTDPPTETTEPVGEDPTAEPAENPTKGPDESKPETKKGCGGIVGGMAVMACVALAATVVIKKKER